MEKENKKESVVLILGGGAFGTSLAHVVSEKVDRVEIFVRRKEHAEEIHSSYWGSY